MILTKRLHRSFIFLTIAESANIYISLIKAPSCSGITANWFLSSVEWPRALLLQFLQDNHSWNCLHCASHNAATIVYNAQACENYSDILPQSAPPIGKLPSRRYSRSHLHKIIKISPWQRNVNLSYQNLESQCSLHKYLTCTSFLFIQFNFYPISFLIIAGATK